ncbi:non-heme iron oxygenase ferredoxin subunit [Cellulomonas marina]|uniref:3-phenylpropionate/trans-cinnamate dioxygenase ferredoxin subunit n=1 Tax=Cellulomonas marina TaxID=988821 RepID=A0A1I0ZS09_9CELL|nr:non-heme iron oxygenase ferredoxin subunit [Cellulomonas marina]GIG28790.1 (2Fe-2S)-binding protein [Cellulomonas marina]SFB28599.1 3-phenylpropionate/trans-cinnamate dioxygenase ferredoxin subunit [Cellulomonas marina]
MTAQHVCDTADLAPAETLRVELDAADGTSVEVAVVRDEDGDWHAISDVCSHGQVSLAEGEVEGCAVECWLHGSSFDLRTGKPLGPPAIRPVPVYPVTVDGERVLVDVDAPL